MGPDLGCPTWCVSTAEDHEADESGAWLHQGPDFGLLRIWYLEGPEAGFSVTIAEPATGDLSPSALRLLSADALDAAMWIDRNSQSVLTPRHASVADLVRGAHAQSTRSA